VHAPDGAEQRGHCLRVGKIAGISCRVPAATTQFVCSLVYPGGRPVDQNEIKSIRGQALGNCLADLTLFPDTC
jgi:hypothetical protein